MASGAFEMPNDSPARVAVTRGRATRPGGHWEWDLAGGGRVHGRRDLHDPRDSALGWKGTFDALLELIHPEDRAGFREAIDHALIHGSAQLEHRVLRPTGGLLRTHAHRGDRRRRRDARPPVGTCQDTTEQKVAEREIEHSRQFLAAITDNMAEG